MANDYVLFCESLRLGTKEEHAWVRAQLDWDFFTNDEGDPTGLTPPPWFDEEGECLPFSYDIEDNAVIFFSEESGSPGAVAEFVHAFLKTFNHDEGWGLEYAYTCDKPRCGHFGGGAFFVTKDTIKGEGTVEWLSRCREAHGER